MDDSYRIESIGEPGEGEWAAIGGGIRHYNREKAGDNQFQRLCLVLRAPDGAIAGGIIGATYWGWLYIDLLWIKEELRGLGYGGRLLAMAEEEARGRGARQAYLDTFSFQALDFYQGHGYRVFGELPDFPPGHQRYFLTKEL